MSNRQVQDPQYYGEIFADPHRFDRVWVVEMNIHVTDDGGRSWRQQPAQGVHVDHHAMVFNPHDSLHIVLGNDGGLYETFDRQTWRHFNNLPIGQFYRIGIDNAWPFYNVTGGLQDNGSQAGPTRSAATVGVRVSEWFSTGGGDGMQARVDPDDPDIMYSQTQSSTSRFEKRTGVTKSIRPNANNTNPRWDPRKDTVQWHWDVPLVISPFDSKTIYMAGSHVFRSRDRGDSWEMISPNLTRRINRDTLPIMGRVWRDSSEWVSRNTFTNDYGTSLAFAESPLREGFLWWGSDDGVVAWSDNGGKSWTRITEFPGVPSWAQVTDIIPSRHDLNTVYVSLANYNRGDFTPYVFKSTDRGRSWTSLRANIPDRQFIWSLAEDHVNRNLLFAGTEFGLFVTVDGGQSWIQMKNGLPTIAVRDLEIQRRESDLVLGTFGRSIYVLDDYSPLRELSPATVQQEAALLPLRHALQFPMLSWARNELHGYASPNPQYGAVITYFLKQTVAGASPTGADSTLLLSIADAKGRTVRRLPAPPLAGINRVAWSLRGEPVAPRPVQRDPEDEQQQRDTTATAGRAGGAGGAGAGRQGGAGGAGAPGGGGRFGGARPDNGEPVAPGKYTVTLQRKLDGKYQPLGRPQTFEVFAVDAVPKQQNRR
jgi:photosystem II stability/assembly factor-like uncharacterized protein